jgi:hypothetical protein
VLVGRSFLCACAWAFVMVTVRAHAAEVAFEAPSDCERAENVRDQIERLIGMPLEGVRGADFAVKVVGPSGTGWSATVHVTPRGGAQEPSARTITGQSCAEVSAAAAVSIAMAIEQERGTATAERPPPPASKKETTSPVETPAAPPTPAPTTRAPVESSGGKLHLALALHGLVDAGALPSPSPGAELDVKAGSSALYAVGFGSLLAPQEARLEDGRGGRFRLASVGLLACGQRTLAAFEGRACAGFEWGWMSAEGVRIDLPRTESAAYRALRVELGLGWPLGAQLSLVARGALLVPLAPPRFVLNGTEPVHQPSAFGGRALLGLEFEI